jgi:hypothetical protein
VSNIERFIKEYSPGSKEQICFSWNGKHGEELVDENYEFRNEVANALLTKSFVGPGELIKDILLAEAELSKEIWGATSNLSAIGTLLLTQTRSEFVDDFFCAKSRSFDTECDLTCGEVPQEILKNIVFELKEKVAKGKGHKNFDFYIGYFSENIQQHEENSERNNKIRKKRWWQIW